MPISIMDCINAKWPKDNEYICCSKGHKVGNGKIHTRRVDRGAKLIYRVRHTCKEQEGLDKIYKI